MIKMMPTRKELRKFCLIILVYLMLVVGIIMPRYFHHSISLHTLEILSIVITLSFIFPTYLIPIKRLFDFLLSCLHWFNMRVLLGILFFFIFSPVSYCRRLLRKDALNLTLEKTRSTYRNSNIAHDDFKRPY